ncbi:uncharacterized protein BDFB_002462, partial [Asbolus verrucosus]
MVVVDKALEHQLYGVINVFQTSQDVGIHLTGCGIGQKYALKMTMNYFDSTTWCFCFLDHRCNGAFTIYPSIALTTI